MYVETSGTPKTKVMSSSVDRIWSPPSVASVLIPGRGPPTPPVFFSMQVVYGYKQTRCIFECSSMPSIRRLSVAVVLYAK